MTTAILTAPAVCRYSGILTALAENDTIGITADADTNLHTVPAGGQSLAVALEALAVLCRADGYIANVSQNDEFDQCLKLQGAGGISVTLTLPVYAVA